MRAIGLAALLACALALSACGDREGQVGEFSNDLLGNEIMIEALPDPELPGVVCHIAYFDRSFLDRMRQGNWFENPSNSAVSCQRIGAIDLAGVNVSRAGEEIFSQRQSLFFKNVAIRRIVDLENRSILYISHSRELVEGSAKLDISTIALTAAEAAAARGN
ncbi:MAG TPA: CreA family protein [Vitreimonas sp.]|uniref:CreA family protein n=1 Tax=Vitreimonas sp. TaxID=3069702 RepID=UPI002D6E90DD|nr:CreA family protein [Vitreimonas sp.]HYD89065.1 CreA family protein [Vitreimonas sp.]